MRPEMPDNCPPALLRLTRRCWDDDPLKVREPLREPLKVREPLREPPESRWR
jgi:hypothetical protein